METVKKISLNGNDWLMKEFVGMDWIWRDSVMPDSKDVRWWYPATVPGSVMHDLAENRMIQNPHYELNTKLGEWASERTWVYRKEFFVPEDEKGREITLCFDGIDYASEIFLNGVSLGKQEGMYIPWKHKVTDRIQYGEKNLIAVVIEPAPPEQPQVGKTSLVTTHKSRMTYWWDFCPRMIHQGIWQDTYLEITGETQIVDLHVETDFIGHCARVRVQVLTQNAKGCKYYVAIGDKTCMGIADENSFSCELKIENPRLWWCNGQGEPYEYEINIQLYDRNGCLSDKRNMKYGIRKIEFVENEGVNDEKGRFLLKLNGRKVFINGYNWVPADMFYGAVKEEKVSHLIKLAKRVGINMFRVWGGGLIERDSFYRMCAEAGILIWQEFILSSSGIDNKPSLSNNYRMLMKEQAEVIIRLKRNQTALAVWCGGNELQNDDGTPINEDNLLIKVIGDTVHRLDAGRKWLPTSPSGGVFLNSFENLEKYPDQLYDVHGPWEHQGLKKHYKLYNQGTCLLHSEFGVEGMTNAGALYKNVSDEHLMPASKDNPVYFHRGAWWNNEPLVQEMFGGHLTEVEQIRRASQYMQYEGLKYAMECNRRRAFHCSGIFPWQFNEPYPNFYCTSALDYYGNPKPVYYAIKKVYGDYLVNASFESTSLNGKKELKADLFAASNLEESITKEISGYEIVTQLWTVEGELLEQKNFEKKCLHTKADCVGEFIWKVKEVPNQLVLLRVYLQDNEQKILAQNEYLFTLTEHFGEVFFMDEPKICVRIQENFVSVINNGNTAALFVFVKKEEGESIYLDDNYFSLLPGENRDIKVEGNFDSLEIETLNWRNDFE